MTQQELRDRIDKHNSEEEWRLDLSAKQLLFIHSLMEDDRKDILDSLRKEFEFIATEQISGKQAFRIIMNVFYPE